MGDLLLDTVLFLARHRSRAGKAGTKLLSEASGKFTHCDERELERFFKENPEQGDTSEMGKFVFLPLVPKPRLLPVLNLAYDIPNDLAKLQVALFTETDQPGIRAFGYRFEPPEGPGRHDYWHAQPILRVGCHDDSTIDLPGLEDGWRPTDTPAFPLDARSPIGLLVALMVSIYGLDEVWRMQADSPEVHLAGALRPLFDPTLP
jgi:hypothetical protein